MDLSDIRSLNSIALSITCPILLIMFDLHHVIPLESQGERQTINNVNKYRNNKLSICAGITINIS